MLRMWVSMVFGDDVELLGDAAVGAALGDEGEDLELAWRQRGQWVMECWGANQFGDEAGVDDRSRRRRCGGGW